MREWEVRTSCRVWRGRYVIRGGVDRIANDIADLQHGRFPGLDCDKVSLRVAIMSVMAILAEECSEDGVTAAELSFLLTTSLARPISPARIASEIAALEGFVWAGELGSEPLYTLEKRGLGFFKNSWLRAQGMAGATAEGQKRVDMGAVVIDLPLAANPAPHARYRLAGA